MDDDTSYRDGPRSGWRARRKERALDKRALRAEFEIDRPRGFARVRAFVAEVGELEAARLRAHDAAAPQRVMAARAAVNRRAR
jgi:hypothetical protein